MDGTGREGQLGREARPERGNVLMFARKSAACFRLLPPALCALQEAEHGSPSRRHKHGPRPRAEKGLGEHHRGASSPIPAHADVDVSREEEDASGAEDAGTPVPGSPGLEAMLCLSTTPPPPSLSRMKLIFNQFPIPSCHEGMPLRRAGLVSQSLFLVRISASFFSWVLRSSGSSGATCQPLEDCLGMGKIWV